MQEIFNRDALFPGMDISRMTKAWISRGIVLRTQGIRVLLSGTGISHNAKLILKNNKWYAGDALMGQKAQLTPLEEWEEDMVKNGAKAIVTKPIGVSYNKMEASARYWEAFINGKVEYDTKAIGHLVFFYSTAELLGIKLGDEDRLYCTESIKEADVRGGAYNQYRRKDGSDKINPTPGTHRKRIVGDWKTIEIVDCAFTEFGKKFQIPLGRLVT